MKLQLKESGKPVLVLVAIIWVVEVVNWVLGHSLNGLGIGPRSITGLTGLVTAPFLHAGPWHALSNTFPLLVFGYLLSVRSVERFIRVSLYITVLGGAAVWLFGRGAVHVGASGLVFGLFGYLLAAAWYERSPAAIGSAVVVVLLYGGLVWGLVPSAGVSVESHIFGLLVGAWLARVDVKSGVIKH
ncbi:MAG: rhomboid family intramembrane serine protease [Chromatiales bacterium]|jgi:membrane associated rhomboid family serine protease|nr:rhomboid family intramembrane serine protease [Chromatiales bacterium]